MDETELSQYEADVDIRCKSEEIREALDDEEAARMADAFLPLAEMSWRMREAGS